MESAGKHKLAYVGDSSLSSMFVGNLPKGAMEALKAVNDVLSQEQYMDFVTNRRFRNSIICKSDKPVQRNLDEGAIFNFHLLPTMQPEDGKTTAPMNFRSNTGGVFTANDAAAAGLYQELCRAATRPVAAEELIARAKKTMALTDDAPLRQTLKNSGLRLALHGYIHLTSDSSPAAEKAGDKPEVFKWARYQAAQPGCKNVTNMLHTSINSDVASNMVMTLMDGTRTREQITAEMVKKAQDGTLTVRNGETPVTDEAQLITSMRNIVDQLAVKLAQQNLLSA
jgi:methyltransferase-like protein